MVRGGEKEEKMLVEIEARDAVRILRMNHAQENRFNQPFLDEMSQALIELEAEPAVKAVVLTGAQEKFFSNGLDLSWLISQPRENIIHTLLEVNRFLLRVLTYPKPVVAAMNGHAFAGGLLLALAADWRVMREDRGWCCFPEVELGIDLPPGSVALVAHVVGHRNTDHLLLSGKKFSAVEALALGLIDELAAQEEVLPRALAVAAELSAKANPQYAKHKLGLRADITRVMTEEDPAYIRSRAEGRQTA